MERVAFLVEPTNEMLTCLLNPETLVLRRTAGVKVRQSVGTLLTGMQLSDDPLLFTGGGRTELELELLFDIHLSGSTLTVEDVRDLTGPLWNLAENTQGVDAVRHPPLVRFIWGRRWNIPGVIVAVSERLDDFTSTGAPQRSWLKMRLVRVRESDAPPPGQAAALAVEVPLEELEQLDAATELAEERLRYHSVVQGDRLDNIAFRYYGNAAYWRLLASYNGLSSPNRLEAGTLLFIPPAPAVIEQVINIMETDPEAGRLSFSSILRLPALSPLRETL